MKRSRIAPMSAKRRAERQQRRDTVTAAYDRDRGCVAQHIVPELPCYGPLDGDERLSRAQRSGGHLDVENVQILCRRCHEFRTNEAIHSTVLLLRDPRRGLIRHFPGEPPTVEHVRAAVEALALWKAAAAPYTITDLRINSRARAALLWPAVHEAWHDTWHG